MKCRFYLGLPPEIYSNVKLMSQYCGLPKENILLGLKKMGLDDIYEQLADDFFLSAKNFCNKLNNRFIKI